MDCFQAVQDVLQQIIRPYVHEQTVLKMAALFEFVCNQDLLADFYTKRKWKECEQMGTVLRKLWDAGYFN
jgi:hypothetical protein